MRTVFFILLNTYFAILLLLVGYSCSEKEGMYLNGIEKGEWNYYNYKGELVSIEEYDY